VSGLGEPVVFKDAGTTRLSEPEQTSARTDNVLSFRAVGDQLSSPLPKLITAFGIICISVSLALLFIDDTVWFVVPYILGIVLSFGGTVAWARNLEVRRKVRIAGWIFVLGLTVFYFIPNNIHGDGTLVGMIVLCGWLLSIVLVIMAAVARDDAEES